MKEIVIKRGLNVPIVGEPGLELYPGSKVDKVALLGEDYPGMKPTMLVKIEEKVKLGQPLFEDKKSPGIFYTSPASGRVSAIHRGDKRAFLSIVIDVEGDSEFTFNKYTEGDLASLPKKEVIHQLIQSGLWTAIRMRPYDKVANPADSPHSVFIPAMDTNPLSPDMSLIIKNNEKHFKNGLRVLSKLTEGFINVCVAPNSPVSDLISSEESKKVKTYVFKGPHPAGLVGTHIHFIDPVGPNKTVWHIGLQDVIAYGKFFTSGKIPVERVVSMAGPGVISPKVITTRLGASIHTLASDVVDNRSNRLISGSVLSGKNATDETVSFLGRYDQSVCVLKEGETRTFLGMLMPGINKFSIKNIFLSKLFPRKKYAFTTTSNGSKRAMVPVGSYESVMPLDVVPTYLLRAIIVEDTEKAVELGALELTEEDLALCTFVCPSKYDYGSLLRNNLTRIEKEG